MRNKSPFIPGYSLVFHYMKNWVIIVFLAFLCFGTVFAIVLSAVKKPRPKKGYESEVQLIAATPWTINTKLPHPILMGIAVMQGK
jgi:hypothetical protein